MHDIRPDGVLHKQVTLESLVQPSHAFRDFRNFMKTKESFDQ